MHLVTGHTYHVFYNGVIARFHQFYKCIRSALQSSVQDVSYLLDKVVCYSVPYMEDAILYRYHISKLYKEQQWTHQKGGSILMHKNQYNKVNIFQIDNFVFQRYNFRNIPREALHRVLKSSIHFVTGYPARYPNRVLTFTSAF